MKFIKIILAIFAFLILGVIVYGFLLPAEVKIEKSIFINVPREKAENYLIDLHNWERWNNWDKIDSNIRYDYRGPEKGVGAVQTWSSKKAPSGRSTITGHSPGKSIYFRIDWKSGETAMNGYFKFMEKEGGTELVWGHKGNMGNNPFKRIYGQMLERMFGNTFKESLKNMKRVMEEDLQTGGIG